MTDRLELDGTKIGHHIAALNKWKHGETVYPVLVEISPTNQCNHRCLFCAYEYLQRQPAYFIDLQELLRITKELYELGTKSLFYSGEGEPLLHKGLSELIEGNAAIGFDQALNTNGVLLAGDRLERILPHLSWIRFSVNAGTPQSYATVHGTTAAEFERVLGNIATAVRFKRHHGLDVTIGIQLIRLDQSTEEIYTLARRVKDLGAEYFAVKDFNQHPAIQFSKPVGHGVDGLEKLSQLNATDFRTAVRSNLLKDAKRSYKSCLALPFFAEIISNGDVYSCGPHLGVSDFCYGNIRNRSFQSLWSSSNRDRVERSVAQIDDLDGFCMPNCRLHAVNEFLWGIINPPDHINFI